MSTNKEQYILPQKLLDKIIQQAQSEMPNEACGYLAGKNNTAVKAIPMENIDHSPEHFRFNVQEQFAAMKTARSDNLTLNAVYHSHPATPARMSDEDIRLANDISTTYVIYSLADKTAKAFRIDTHKLVREIRLVITKT